MKRSRVPGAFRSRRESRLTRFYVLALFSGLIFFYAALPLVFVGLLLVFLATLVLSIFVRRNSAAQDVHAMLLRASGGGMGAVFKALFAQGDSRTLGVRPSRKECPKLFTAIYDVAERVDTDPPDEVWIAPGAEFSVYQKGRGPFGMFGSRKRVLTIGLCVLSFLTIDEFKSILAHEFAHFSHADTFWHRFLFQVHLSLNTAIKEMARTGGWVTYLNPFFWFFWLYSRSFGLLASGFSRSREFLADRMACQLYGSDVFTEALRKVCTDGADFEAVIYDNILSLLRKNQAFVNMYLAFRTYRNEHLTEKARKRLHDKLLTRPSSLYASHPTFHERLEAAQIFPIAQTKNNTAVLNHFKEPEAIERELTDYLTEALADS